MKEVIKIIPKYRADKKNKEKQKPKRLRKKKTHEKYVEEVKIKNPNVTVVGTYIDSKTKIIHKCNICNREWNGIPAQILRGVGCPSCSKRRNVPKKTHEEYIKEVQTKNPKIIVLGKYINSKTKILHKCTICYHEWEATPDSILRGTGCIKCHLKNIKTPKKTHEQFIKDMANINNTITIIGKYNGSKKPIECKCNKCNYIWKPKAADILSGKGCPRCVGRNKTTEDFIKEISKINLDIEIIGEYINATTPIKCRCKICNHEWNAKPDNLHYTGCPICKSSHGERLIKTFLINYNINFEFQKSYDGLFGIKNRHLSYDFYLPEYNLLIEFQGEQHERPVEYFGGEEKFKVQQEHDNRKREFAKLHNINLLEIWYYDINNIEKILTETLNNLKLKTVETTGIA